MAYETYKPSGAFTVMSIPLGLVVGLLVAVGGAWGYQFLCDLIPFIYLNFLITLVFGFLVGAGTGIGLKMGHCRSGMIALLVILATSFGAIGASHYFARDTVIDVLEVEALGEEVTQDDIVYVREMPFMDYLSARAELGYVISRNSGDDGSDITGFGVWTIWTIEGLGILVVAAISAFGVAMVPYCEPSGAYCVKTKLGSLSNVDQNEALAAHARGDLDSMILPPRNPIFGASIAYTLFTSPVGQGPTYLSGKLSYQNNDKQDSLDLIDEAIVTPEQVEALRAYMMQAPETPTLPAGPVLDSNDGFDDL